MLRPTLFPNLRLSYGNSDVSFEPVAVHNVSFRQDGAILNGIAQQMCKSSGSFRQLKPGGANSSTAVVILACL